MHASFIDKLTEITEANLSNEHFGVSELASELGMSRVTLHRKIKNSVNKSATGFIREMRLKKAIEMLRQTDLTVAEIAFAVGFGSAPYFSKCFHDYFGITPGEVMKGIHPEVEDVPVERKKTFIQKLTVSKSFYFGFIVVLLAVVIVLFFKYQRVNKPVEKSIAVLPFINDSPDTTYVYFINGVTEAIINNLSAIKDLRVASRSSAEQYRNNSDKSITQIASELGVNYIVEGSGQRIDNMIKLSIQLIEAKTDKHLFSQSYERDLEEIFSLQSEIARLVASKINAVITPEENKQIESKPTKNIAALNQFLKGAELRQLAEFEKNKSFALQAEVFLRKAIQLDSTYVAPYVGLGWNYNLWHGDLDSGMYFANRALLFDNNNPGALGLKGWILMNKGLYKESEELLQQVIKYNPNDRIGYQFMGALGYYTGEYAKSIEHQLKALKLGTSNYEIGNTLNSLCNYLYLYGFYEEGLKFAEMQIEKNNDSLLYYQALANIDLQNGNDSSALQNIFKAQNWKTSGWWNPFFVALAIKDCKTAAAIADRSIENAKKQGITISSNYYIGYAFLLNGESEKAKLQFEGAVKRLMKMIEQKDENFQDITYLDLIYTYSAMGNKEKAMEYVKMLFDCKDFEIQPKKLFDLKNHPIFETIRDEPDFQKLIQKNEARIQPEMKKIEKILRDYWSEN